jgi:hypothetical protein
MVSERWHLRRKLLNKLIISKCVIIVSAVLPKRKLIGRMYTRVGPVPALRYLICVEFCRVGAMHEIKSPCDSLFINGTHIASGVLRCVCAAVLQVPCSGTFTTVSQVVCSGMFTWLFFTYFHVCSSSCSYVNLKLTLQSPVVTICTTRFNTLKLYILPTRCTCVFHMVLTVNSDCFLKQH